MIFQADGPSDAKALIDDTVEKGVDFIKLVVDRIPPDAPELDAATTNALVDEAHKHKLKVFVHVGSADDALVALHAHADFLAHTVWRTPIDDAAVHEIGNAHLPIIHTLHGWQATDAIATGRYAPDPLDLALAPRALTEPATGSAGAQFATTPVIGEMAASVHKNAAGLGDVVKRLTDAGAPVLVGTDSPLPGDYPGSSFHLEMRALHDAGVNNGEILRGATGRAAHLLTDTPSFGTIEPGKDADLVLVDGDPLVDLERAHHLDVVMKAGRIVQRPVVLP
jgi:imidazolonepropionase-like amidohydrolase